MIDFFSAHRNGFWTPAHKRSLYLSLLLIILALVIQVSAGQYSSRHAMSASYQNDLFLDNLPIIDLTFIIVGGAIAFWIFSSFFLATYPEHLLFGIKAIALFIIFRAFFINLTHEGLYPGSFMPTADNTGFSFYRRFTFEGNLFFSGHTGFPFIMALIFWDKRPWRWFFLFATAIFGAAVLLAHVHYSIDVFSAPFIVYGIFAITKKVFPHDYALFEA